MPYSEKRIRLLLIIDEAKLGGGQKHVLWLAKYLPQEKFETTVICGGSGYLTEKLEKEGIECVVLPGKISSRDILRLRKEMKRIKPAIVHTHGTVAGVWGRLAALKFRKPKFVHTLHGIHYLHFPGSLKKVVGIRSERILCKFTERIVCVSEADRKRGLSNRLFPADKTTVIRNGVEEINVNSCTGAAQLRQELGLSPDDIVIGSVGRLRREKGHIYLLAAVSLMKEELPQAKFIIVGEGSLEKFLRQKTQELGLDDRILFLGSREDVPALLQIFDILVLPSLWEGLPLIILEAMQAGKAIVASKIDSLEEIITDQKEGLLFPVGSAEDLAGILRELAGNPQKRKLLGENARRKAEDFLLTKMIKNYEELYLNLVSKNRR